MTVRYTAPLATNSSLGCFSALLFRWRGSVYKLIWAEYLVFISLYYFIFCIYRFALNDEQGKVFEQVVNYCEKSGGSLEMSFVLGFFVTSIVAKWWSLYLLIPWPDTTALFVNANIRGNGESTKFLRKTIVRYCNLNLALTFRTISPPFKRRYPTLDHFIKSGLLYESEKEILQSFDKQTTHGTQWLPITWASELVIQAHDEGRILGEIACQRILDKLDEYRQSCILLLEYEHSSVPLVYIQVVTISVYTYFLSCLMGSQWIKQDPNFGNLDLYFPFFTTLQFIFYMGWLKVAESLINPFGTDDDDFELEDILERHIQVTNLMVNSDRSYPFTKIYQHPRKPLHFTNPAFDKCEWRASSPQSNSGSSSVGRVSSPPPRFTDVVMTVDVSQGPSIVVTAVKEQEQSGNSKKMSLSRENSTNDEDDEAAYESIKV